jgi:Tol biopolymer transport system component
LSPDEQSVVLCEVADEARDVFTYDVVTGVRRRLTYDDRLEDIAQFLPDGRILYYESGALATRILDPLRSGEPALLGPGIMAGPAPGGEIVFARSRTDAWDFDIFSASLEGFTSELDTLVYEPGVQWFPVVSPDGRFLLYTGEQSGRPEVYLTTYPETDRHWQVSSEGGSQAVWTKGGTEILYTTRDRIWAASFSSEEEAVSLGVPRPLFDRPSMDWSPQWNDGFDATADGERILLIRPQGSEADRVPVMVFVQNWTAGIDAGR